MPSPAPGQVLEYVKLSSSIVSMAKFSDVMVSSDVRLVNFEALKWSDRSKLWSQKMLAIFEAMGLYNNILSDIRLSALPDEQE
jgi:hypothetical protein